MFKVYNITLQNLNTSSGYSSPSSIHLLDKTPFGELQNLPTWKKVSVTCSYKSVDVGRQNWLAVLKCMSQQQEKKQSKKMHLNRIYWTICSTEQLYHPLGGPQSRQKHTESNFSIHLSIQHIKHFASMQSLSRKRLSKNSSFLCHNNQRYLSSLSFLS